MMDPEGTKKNGRDRGSAMHALATVAQWHRQLRDVKKNNETQMKERFSKALNNTKKKIFNECKYISYWEDYFKISSDRGLRSWLILLSLVGIFGIHLSIMKQRSNHICAQY